MNEQDESAEGGLDRNLLASMLIAALNDAASPFSFIRLDALWWAEASLNGVPGDGDGFTFTECCEAFNLNPRAVLDRMKAAVIVPQRKPGWALPLLLEESAPDLFGKAA